MTPSEELKDAWTIINILHMERMDAHEVWPRALEWLKRNEAHGPNAVPEPQWYNPENYPRHVLTEDRRFLTEDELILPDDAEYYDDDNDTWIRALSSFRGRMDALTYATRTPLPK